MHKSIKFILCGLLLFTTAGTSYGQETEQAADDRPTPNIVIVFTDDQGYADLGCFGATEFETPNIDQMAREGRRFTSFYVSQAVCGASRASLLTGCYANRIGMLGAPSHSARHGINPNEVLIPELCKQQGYRTAMFGKWHLGHHLQSLPLQNGFDEYFGLPYSNDMWPYHPTSKAFPDLPLYEGNEIINPKVTPDDQVFLTTWYTERAVDFIDRNPSNPFFLYVAHSMPHVPLFVSEKFEGKSEQGLYGDVISEIDWSVGEILKALKRNNIDRNTLVIFTSDNGPWLSYGNHAGSAGVLREGKGTSWEGGVREPCVMRWPGQIPAGTECHELAATIDLFPTIADLIGAKLPEHPIDGKNIWPLMSGVEDAQTPHEYYCYYWGNHLHCIRSGPWKLHFPHSYRSLKDHPGKDGTPSEYYQAETDLALYNLDSDLEEQNDVKEQHPEIVQKLKEYAEQARVELGDSAMKVKGSGYRDPARFDGPPSK
ncbi:sulfatase [Thalassoglobus sp. JC818]|uniref:sulfatase family protein n=1 Tax=Thalassoglobus sp. JC818 TaxID=3232136 RepID=UPI003459EA72